MNLFKILYYLYLVLFVDFFPVQSSATETICHEKNISSSQTGLSEILVKWKASFFFSKFSVQQISENSTIEVRNISDKTNRLLKSDNFKLSSSKEKKWFGLLYLDENGKIANHPNGAVLSQANQKIFQNVGLAKAYEKLDDLGDDVLRKDPDFLKKFDEVLKNDGLNKHVFEGDVKITGTNSAGDPIYKVTGVHSDKAFSSGKVRIKEGTKSTPDANGYYTAKVEVEIEGFSNHLGEPWKVKSDPSTFFPDNWSVDKIRKEISVGLSDAIPDVGNRYIGTMSDGTKLAIHIEEGIIKSAYPIIP